MAELTYVVLKGKINWWMAELTYIVLKGKVNGLLNRWMKWFKNM